MEYKCLECGHIFADGEEAVWCESRGECWGTSCSELVSGCPICHGEYAETTSCKICGSKHLEEELEYGMCDECIDFYGNDVDVCYKIGESEQTPIKVNSFLASVLSLSDIEFILLEAIRNDQNIDCSKFVNEDRSWFAERLAEEVKKNENRKG